MKANKFVKENGIEKCKRILDDLTDQGHNGDFYKELKRLVESHELVVQCGGLEDARSHLESIRFNIATKTWFGQALLNWSMYADKLEKAIADVESCQ